MKKQYAKLGRRPLLTPIWLAAVASVVVVSFAAWLWGTANSTTIVVVRSAENRADAADDPPLDARGNIRAERLASLFTPESPRPLQAIYVSATQLSRQTALPLARALQLALTISPNNDPRKLARQVLQEQQGRAALIVTRRDAMPALVESLSGEKAAPIADDEYGALYVVTVPRIGHASVLRMNY